MDMKYIIILIFWIILGSSNDYDFLSSLKFIFYAVDFLIINISDE